MIEYCQNTEWTQKKLYIIVNELNNLENTIKGVLQFQSYFVRPDFRQKPDVEIAVERYKEISDKRSLEQLRALAGKNSKIDFDSLGSSRVELKDEIEYDPAVDGDDDPKLADVPVEEEEEKEADTTTVEEEEDEGESK